MIITIGKCYLPLVGKGGGGKRGVDSIGGGGGVSTIAAAGGGVSTIGAGGASTIGAGGVLTTGAAWGAGGGVSTTGDVVVIDGDRSGMELLLDGLLTGVTAVGAGSDLTTSCC